MKYYGIIHEETGSSLAAVLAMITILSALVGAVMAVQLARQRFVRADNDTIQAQYTAEAGIHAAMKRLRDDHKWRPHEERLELPGDLDPAVSVEAFGGYLVLVSTGEKGARQVTVRTLLAESPLEIFDAALFLWDDGSRLNVAGETRISGDIYAGERGVRKNAFEGKPFAGSIEGEIVAMTDPSPPNFDGSMLLGELSRLDSLRKTPAHEPESDTSLHASFLPGRNKRVLFPGNVRLSASDSLLFSRPLTVVAEKDLMIEGPLRMRPGSILIAGENLYLEGRIEGREVLAFGRTGIDGRRIHAESIQLLSRGPISLGEHSHLEYPSFLFTTGEFATDSSRIALKERSTVEGFVMFYALSPVANEKAAHLLLDENSLVRGAVYNSASTHLEGSIFGTLLSRNTYFYEKPSHYTNWLVDAEIDVGKRPAPYTLPLGFGNGSLEYVSWRFVRSLVPGHGSLVPGHGSLVMGPWSLVMGPWSPVNGKPQTANRKRQTANRKPQTANRKPQTANKRCDFQ